MAVVIPDSLIRQLVTEGRSLSAEQAAEVLRESGIVADCDVMRRVVATAMDIAGTDAVVRLEGETGTGKGVLARLTHLLSGYAHGPFVTVDCTNIREENLASELFGHVKGAFTGAICNRVGKLQAANHGTTFLDEIGELPATIQAKLLRFTDEFTFERFGSNDSISVDTRLIVATNRKLQVEMAKGRFRPDLYYRLNDVVITMPPLRTRAEDRRLMAERFVRGYCEHYRRPVRLLAEDALAFIDQYVWPGNIREMQSMLKRAVIREKTDSIRLASLCPEPERVDDALTVLSSLLKERRALATQHFDLIYLVTQFLAAHGNASKASKQSGASRKRYTRIKSLLREAGVRIEDCTCIDWQSIMRLADQRCNSSS